MTFHVNGGVEAMRIDASGNVGIGTSPAQKLHVVGTSRPALIGSDNAVNIVKLYNSATGSGSYNGLDLLVNSTSNTQIKSYGMPLTFGTSASNGTDVTERMRIDASGNVGIGRTPVTYGSFQVLDVAGATGAIQKIVHTGNNVQLQAYASSTVGVLGTATSHDLLFVTGDGERMRIDTSGNLLVGTTNANPTSSSVNDPGVELSNTGGVRSTVASNPAATFNRKTDDGDIAIFRKDGSTVGSIGVDYGDNLFISGNSTHVGLMFDSTHIWPYKNGNFVDATVDLGVSSGRFKDLYLSGGVYLGGTGSANKLDDYEEGTWTPVFSPATAFTSITYDVATGGSYTKVGNVVHIRGAVRTDAINGGSGTVRIGGLPFTSSSVAPLGTFSIGYLNNFSGDSPGGIYINGGATTATIVYRTGANTGLDNNLQVADLNTGGNANYILFSGSYYVA
jgi:hypothetical protein